MGQWGRVVGSKEELAALERVCRKVFSSYLPWDLKAIKEPTIREVCSRQMELPVQRR